jgi:hypothetical protein
MTKLAPFASDHPHVDEYGHYAVPAVNLVRSGPKRAGSFPAWLFLWLPNESHESQFHYCSNHNYMIKCLSVYLYGLYTRKGVKHVDVLS